MIMVKNLKKNLSIFLAMLMVFCMTSIQVFAKGDLAMLTLDATNFTIVGQKGQTYTIEAKGLTSSYKPAKLEKGKVKWNSSNENVAKIQTIDEDNNTVKIELGKKGEAKVTATYKDEGITEVSANIVVEDEPKGLVKKVKVIICDPNDPNGKNIEVPLTEVKAEDLSKTIGDTKDVLKNNPSALHALIAALKNKNKLEGLTVTSEGSYIESMLGVEGNWDSELNAYAGWQYKVNGKKLDKAASIYQLKDNDEITWEYGPVSFN